MHPRRPRGHPDPGGNRSRPRQVRRTASLLSLGLALVTGSLVWSAVPASARFDRAAMTPPVYVALGDSFTSGPDVPTQLDAASRPDAPSSCMRSSRNYPSLVARALGLTLRDMSCSGATTRDLTSSQGPGIPAQLSALGPRTAVVSVGIGGNDLGFGTIAHNCLAASPWGATKVGWSCASHYTAGGTDQLAATVQQVGDRVSTSLEAIRARAPRARVFVVGYPDIIPATGSGCWPRLPFSGPDVAYLRSVEDQLNAALAGDAARSGATFVDMATPSAAHASCAPAATRWVEPVIPSRGTFPLHPSAVGMAGMARVLTAAMSRAGVEPGWR
jgi:lysophospholipase L1-like esterase